MVTFVQLVHTYTPYSVTCFSFCFYMPIVKGAFVCFMMSTRTCFLSRVLYYILIPSLVVWRMGMSITITDLHHYVTVI